MKDIGAQGVIFHAICTSIKDLHNNFNNTYREYTLEEAAKAKGFPKSGRTYWKIRKGKKVYYNFKSKKYE